MLFIQRPHVVTPTCSVAIRGFFEESFLGKRLSVIGFTKTENTGWNLLYFRFYSGAVFTVLQQIFSGRVVVLLDNVTSIYSHDY